MTEFSSFCYPYARYRGLVHPENLVFDANLQEFSHRVSIISALETGGKITPEEAFNQISSLWEKLETSKKELQVGQQPFQPNE